MLTLSLLVDPIVKSVLILVGVPIFLIITSLYYKLIRKILIKFFNMTTSVYGITDTNITAGMIAGFTVLIAVCIIIRG